MKYFVIAFLIVIAVPAVQAQHTIPQVYTYRQKLHNNSLKMLYPRLQTGRSAQLVNNTQVLQLKNEGVKAGSNSLGDIYSMKTDNMPCLKPFKTKDEIPNVIPSKPLLIMPDDKE